MTNLSERSISNLVDIQAQGASQGNAGMSLGLHWPGSSTEAATSQTKVLAMRRVLPAITLFFVAPLVAEFLLGDLPLKLLGALIILAPMYGGGALLVRELVRRSGRGWPSILMLAFAYAVIEEAFTTQTLVQSRLPALAHGTVKTCLHPGSWHRSLVDGICSDSTHGVEHQRFHRTDRSPLSRSGNHAMAEKPWTHDHRDTFCSGCDGFHAA